MDVRALLSSVTASLLDRKGRVALNVAGAAIGTAAVVLLTALGSGASTNIARELLGLTVEERPLSIEEVIAEGEEMFCTGTAWTLQSVREIVYRDRTVTFEGETTRKQLYDMLRGIQLGEREDPFDWIRKV